MEDRGRNERKTEEREEGKEVMPEEKAHGRGAKNVEGRHRELEREPATEDVKAVGRERQD